MSERVSIPEFTLEDATKFLAEFYRGEHHIPSKIKRCGTNGWEVKHYGSVATTDFNEITRLVLMAHRDCIRVSIAPYNFREMRLMIHKRARGGCIYTCHPTIEEAIEKFNKA